ncbi:Adenylate isopentenyltransferase [Ananas comosus]|uniref:Adenylate isopentenyltransferase n=1 Tax=Ananas comosus TaxID=4615 RepID=A0A199VTM7_ANACO|nr:Adenylate isopentenyltransferase [Ananas comosus]
MPAAAVGPTAHHRQTNEYGLREQRWYSSGGGGADSSNWHGRRMGRGKERVVVIMGATGTGKTKLSIEVAGRLGGEVVNTDKIQVYGGLDITTNKVPPADRLGVPHHLLGVVHPAAGQLPASTFRSLGAAAVASVAARCRLPVLAGGSNSFIHALLARDFRPGDPDPFRPGPAAAAAAAVPIRYDCCFLWVDVEEGVLAEHLDRRVDEMAAAGMVEELRDYFERRRRRRSSSSSSSSSRGDRGDYSGLEKAIGVPEFAGYFAGRKTLGEAVAEIKTNTRRLAEAQVGKIRRMQGEWGWPLRRLDATEAVLARLAGDGGGEADAVAAAWERDVLGPGLKAVQEFLSRNANADAEEDTEDETAAPDAEAEEVQAVVQQLLSSVC